MVLISNFKSLRELAVKYIESLDNNPHKSSPDLDEIEFDSGSGNIEWKFRYNVACHCHPEIVTDTLYYSFESFSKWVNDNNLAVETTTESEFEF
jgi:hypothetical protein